MNKKNRSKNPNPLKKRAITATCSSFPSFLRRGRGGRDKIMNLNKSYILS
jgi:hypothetical protein